MNTGKPISIPEILAAIDHGEIQVYYQPQYDALTNKMHGAEALARWVRPDGTVLLPGKFIPQLEQTDDICTLDWHMLRSVCTFLQEHPEVRSHHIAVNFSRRHFTDPCFLDRLCAIVDEHGLPHRLICVEITESAVVEHGEGIAEWVRQVQEAGFRVAIDDFGSGLSSLSFLKDIPVDVLKIDRALLSGNCEDEKERIVLESIFMFAHRLNMTTVAEGVETGEQLSFLRTSGCKRIQGYLMASPMPESDYLSQCSEPAPEAVEDILLRQTPSSVMQLLMEAVFTRYPLIIFTNVTRNSYYMMAYESFTAQSCPSTGVFDELIAGGAATMHPDDRETFRTAFTRENLLAAHARGEKYVRVVTRQLGDDGVYRAVETVDYFVTNPSTDDVLVITLCQNME